MPVRAFLDSDKTALFDGRWKCREVSMPVRAFLDSDGSGLVG